MNESVMPSNILAEKTILASSLMFPELLDEFAGLLEPDDFYAATHQLMFRTILELYSQNIPVDASVLTAELHGQGRLESVGGAVAISKLLDEPPAVDPQHYVELIKDKGIKRELIKAGNAIQKAAYRDEKAANDLLDEFQEKILKIGNVNQNQCSAIKDLILECSDRVVELHRNKGITGVSSGFYDLDRVLGGFQKTDLYIIAARPSMGKTALALTIARNAANLGYCIGFFSLEMNEGQIAVRLAAMQSGVNLMKFRTGMFAAEDWELLNTAYENLSATKMYIDDSASLSYGQIRRRARRYKKRFGVDLFVIDYLQLIQGDKKSGRVEEVSSISRALKAMAKELDVPVIALSQLSRAVESRENKRPKLSDLRDSGAIEQDADAVIFIYRDEAYNLETTNEGLAEVMIAKQRNGPTGPIRLAFKKKIARFDNLKQNEQNEK